MTSPTRTLIWEWGVEPDDRCPCRGCRCTGKRWVAVFRELSAGGPLEMRSLLLVTGDAKGLSQKPGQEGSRVRAGA